MNPQEREQHMDDLVQKIYWAVEGGRLREAKQLVADEIRMAIQELQDAPDITGKCWECMGTGTIVVRANGQPIGMERCRECWGSGKSQAPILPSPGESIPG